ncbi:MAG: lysylphosphatidylglycerol synthase transmembrane domain-containing protein [Terrimicrobiaceae bacterium]
MRRWLVFSLQVIVSAALLLLIFRDAGFRADVAALAGKADVTWLLGAWLVAGAGCLLGFLRWAIFLRVVGILESPWSIVRMASVGLFFNSFLPGAVGGDAVKVGWLAARGHDPKKALLSVVMDRLSGLGALILCSCVFIPPKWSWLTTSATVAAMIHFAIVYLLVVVFLLGLSFVMSARGALESIPPRFPGRASLVEMASTYRLFVTRWRSTAAASLISAGMLLAYFFTFYFCARAISVVVPAREFLAFMPAVDIIAALPVSLGGFGVREGVFATVLGELSGVPASAAVSLSFAGALVTLLWGCLGLLLLPSYRRETKP